VPELCAAVEEEPVDEEEPEAPAELVAALVVAVVPEVEAPDCAATAACVNAAVSSKRGSSRELIALRMPSNSARPRSRLHPARGSAAIAGRCGR